MKLKCRDCGLVASSDSNATNCSLCNGELESSAASVLSRITKANENAGDPQPDRAEQKRQVDIRPWFVKSIHGRSKGGIVFGIAAIGIGAFGSGIIRSNFAIGGSALVAVGIAVLFFAAALSWFTSPARPYWSE